MFEDMLSADHFMANQIIYEWTSQHSNIDIYINIDMHHTTHINESADVEVVRDEFDKTGETNR